jgi:hypothetical protein
MIELFFKLLKRLAAWLSVGAVERPYSPLDWDEEMRR